MKKMISLLICMAMMLTLLGGCGAGEATTEATTLPEPGHTLKVGYARLNIDPTDSVPMEGYGNTSDRMSTEVTLSLYTTCIAFTDENDKTIILFHNDLITSKTDIMPMLRAKIGKELGIPAANVQVTATHTHSGPALSNTAIETIPPYIEFLKAQMLEAAKQAMADRKPAEMYATTAYPENLNYVRHYIMSDGSVAGDNFGKFSGLEFVGHHHDADNALQMVKFTREGGEDVLLVNWQGHAHRDGGSKKTNISSDIVGVMRENLETNLNCKFAYFGGAGGNVNNNSRIAEEQITKDVYEHGNAIAKYAVDAAPNFKKLEVGNVQLLREDFKVITKETKNTKELDIAAFSIGELAFITAPYEMFDTNGQAIKTGSPFTMTFICTNSNQNRGYIPSSETFDYAPYESYEVKNTSFERGTAEKLVDGYLKLLNELHKTWK